MQKDPRPEVFTRDHHHRATSERVRFYRKPGDEAWSSEIPDSLQPGTDRKLEIPRQDGSRIDWKPIKTPPAMPRVGQGS